MLRTAPVALLALLAFAGTQPARADATFAQAVTDALSRTTLMATSGFLKSDQGVGIAIEHRLGHSTPVTLQGKYSTGPDGHFGGRLGLKIAF